MTLKTATKRATMTRTECILAEAYALRERRQAEKAAASERRKCCDECGHENYLHQDSRCCVPVVPGTFTARSTGTAGQERCRCGQPDSPANRNGTTDEQPDTTNAHPRRHSRPGLQW